MDYVSIVPLGLQFLVAREPTTYVLGYYLPPLLVFLWLRSLTGQKLLGMHHQHLGTPAPDSGQEVSLYCGALPQPTPRLIGDPSCR